MGDMVNRKYDNAGNDQDWFGAARCHSDAVGFVEMKCCGMHADCASKKATEFGRHSCSMAPFGNQGKGKTPCEWAIASRCPAVIAKQKQIDCPAPGQFKKVADCAPLKLPKAAPKKAP